MPYLQFPLNVNSLDPNLYTIQILRYWVSYETNCSVEKV